MCPLPIGTQDRLNTSCSCVYPSCLAASWAIQSFSPSDNALSSALNSASVWPGFLPKNSFSTPTMPFLLLAICRPLLEPDPIGPYTRPSREEGTGIRSNQDRKRPSSALYSIAAALASNACSAWAIAAAEVRVGLPSCVVSAINALAYSSRHCCGVL